MRGLIAELLYRGLNPDEVPITHAMALNDNLEDLLEREKEVVTAGVGEAISEAFK